MPKKGYKKKARILCERWLDANPKWKSHDFVRNGKEGRQARVSMKEYVWPRLPLDEKERFCEGVPPTFPPSTPQFNNSFDMWVVTARGKIVYQRINTRNEGQRNKQTDTEHITERMRGWRKTEYGTAFHKNYNSSEPAKVSQKKYRQTEKGKAVIPPYRATENGRITTNKAAATWREKHREEHWQCQLWYGGVSIYRIQ